MLLFDPDASLDAGVTGKGIANSFCGDFKGEEGCLDFDGEVGEGGVVRIEALVEADAFGEEEARSRVRLEGFAGRISCGRSAM